MNRESWSKTIGAVIRKARQNRGLSLEELSSPIGSSRAVMSLIERGEQNISGWQLVQLVQMLEIDPNDVLGIQVEARLESVEERKQRLMAAYEKRLDKKIHP